MQIHLAGPNAHTQTQETMAKERRSHWAKKNFQEMKFLKNATFRYRKNKHRGGGSGPHNLLAG